MLLMMAYNVVNRMIYRKENWNIVAHTIPFVEIDPWSVKAVAVVLSFNITSTSILPI
jgi:hypothetical protein